jgi:hypothetical protein
MKPWPVVEKQSTPNVRTWQVILPTVSSHPSGTTFAPAEIATLPPQTNSVGRAPLRTTTFPQVVLQLEGCAGGAQTRRRTSQRTLAWPMLQPTLPPVTANESSASARWLDGMNAPAGTSGFTVFVKVFVLVLVTYRTTGFGVRMMIFGFGAVGLGAVTVFTTVFMTVLNVVFGVLVVVVFGVLVVVALGGDETCGFGGVAVLTTFASLTVGGFGDAAVVGWALAGISAAADAEDDFEL